MWLLPEVIFPELRKRVVTVIALIIFTFSLPFATMGQHTSPPKYPSAVLVQLKAERNRINALKNAKRYNELELFQQDVDSVMHAMINDFTDHFHYCPVYYYIDTNFEAIMAKKFDRTLLNTDLMPTENILLNDTDYLIVCYGEPEWQTEKNRFSGKEKWHATNAEGMGGMPNGRGLLINNHKMQQIYYIYRLIGFRLYKKRREHNPYVFLSKKYELEYYPCAGEFNCKLPYKNDDE